MNLMFWKKKAIVDDSSDDSQETFSDMKASRKSREHESRIRDAHDETDGETTDVSSVHSGRKLFIGTTIGVIVLASTAVAVWKTLLKPSAQITINEDTPAVIQPMPLPEKNLIKLPPIGIPLLKKTQSNATPTDVGTLKKNNDELKTQLSTLKAELPHKEKAQAEQQQANIDTLTKMNKELQAQIEALKAELPQIEKAQAEQHQVNIDVLTKKNKELQAQIDALKKKQPQPTISPTDQVAAKDKTQPPAHSGDMAISNKNPKGAAMTVKELIDAMNAGSGNTPQKPNK